MKTKNTSLFAVLLQVAHHAGAFTATTQFSVASRAVSIPSSSAQFSGTKSIHGSSRKCTGLSMTATTTAVPPEEESESLFEGFGKGISRDYKARLPLYKSDIKDGLNSQVGLLVI